jgi:UPF0271 protein
MVDINCDMGEYPEAITDGTQESLMRSITSANIACGGHAGDAETMETTIRQARQYGVRVGAHPGYPDPDNFGRIELDMSVEAIAESVSQQVIALERVAERCGAAVVHVKAHGALYNQAARDPYIARAIADGVARRRRDVIMIGLAGSIMLDVFRDAGFWVAAEGFADRRYEADGTLRSRKFADALIQSPEEAAAQALRLAQSGSVDTICIHGDTPGAVAIASAVAAKLRAVARK